MVLELFYDLLSQPSRSLYMLLKLSNVPFNARKVNLGAGEHLSKEFAETKSKFQKVPFIHDRGFKLNESVGIVRYLVREYPIPDNWYPKDSKLQAKVDEYLEWQHMNIRMNCSLYFWEKFVLPQKTGEEPTDERVKVLKKNMEKSLENFQSLFLAESRFIIGDTICYADINAACEIEQTRMVGYDARDYFPKIKTWINDVRAQTNPIYDETHKFVNMIAASNEKKYKAKL